MMQNTTTTENVYHGSWPQNHHGIWRNFTMAFGYKITTAFGRVEASKLVGSLSNT
jgi:hypothetical protein